MNYATWRARADKGEAKRVTWVCGSERVLVEEVATYLKQSADYVTSIRPTVTEEEMWLEASQRPPSAVSRHRLVTVRRAELISDWRPLVRWVDSAVHTRGTHLLFVFDMDDFPTRVPEDIKDLVQKRGALVKCSRPTDPELIRWVSRRSGMDEPLSAYLLSRAGGSLDLVANVCKMPAEVLRNADKRTIDLLCPEVPSLSFAELLAVGKKREALLAIEALTDHVDVIGELEALLDSIQRVRDSRVHEPAWQTARSLDLPLEVFQRYLAVARSYGPQTIAHRRRVLAVVDATLRSGSWDGVLESLVALW